MGDILARTKTFLEVSTTGGCCPSSARGARSTAPRRPSWPPAFTPLATRSAFASSQMLAAAPEGEICVCEFIQPIGKSQGTISHHLKILGDAGLVHGDRRGKWVWYSLDRDRLARLRNALDG